MQSSSPQPPIDQPLISLSNVSMLFETQSVLRDVSLTIQRGQTVAIIGESGCGKTVCLKTMVGLLTPTQGTVRYDGQVLSEMSPRTLTLLRTRWGFVFQLAALFDSLTIGQNVAFPLRQHTTYTSRQIREIVLTRLAEVGLPDSVVTKKPAELSGGMRKRVGLARALAMDPELIVYDEPTTGLDPIMSDVINELMLAIRGNKHCTSIIVTHDMNSARKVADRIVMLYPVTRLHPGESQVIFDGTPEELKQTRDRRVQQFTRGEAGERLMELRSTQRTTTVAT